MHLALTGKWIPLKTIVEADHHSPLYNERNQTGMFYAESWAVVHLLFVGPDYHEKFGRLMETVGSAPFADVLQRLYGKTMKDVETEVQAALRSDRISVGTFPIKLSKADEEVQSAALGESEMEVVLAEALAGARKLDAARAAYQHIANATSKDPDLQVRLGFLALQLLDPVSAQKHFDIAWDAGAKDSRYCLQYSALLWRADGQHARAIEVLERGLSTKPDDIVARLRLAAFRCAGGDYSGALAECRKITRTDVTHAYTLFSTLAYASARLQKFDDARKFGESARKYTRTAGQKQHADAMMRYLDERQAPGKENLEPPNPWARTTAEPAEQD